MHTKPTTTKHEQNRNKNTHTHTQPTKRTHLRDVSVFCPVHISGRLKSCESITWRFKENEEYVVIRMAAAGFTFVASRKNKDKEDEFFW